MKLDEEILDLNDEEREKETAEPTVEKEEAVEEKSVARELISWVIPLAIALALALFLKNFIIINATVPTGSMENTIMIDDNIFGLRTAYWNAEPQRGDIIIFRWPDDETQKYVKRLIGLPGEKVTIKDGFVYINDSEVPLDEPYLKEEWVRATGPYEFQVPEGCYLMLGDNRNRSSDARYWNNPYVTKEQIIGKALYVYYPFDRMGALE